MQITLPWANNAVVNEDAWVMSFIYIRKGKDPSREPCNTPHDADM